MIERWRRRALRFGALWLGASVLWLGVVACFTDRNHTSPYLAEPSAAVVDEPVPTLRVILIGDAGEALLESPVLRAATDVAGEPAARTVAIYLGDNVYPSGVPERGDPFRAHAEATLLAQIGAFEAVQAQVYFTPGNHDWAEGGAGGYQNLLRERDFIRDHGAGRAALLPADGTPGPACVDEAQVRLVFVDTQWWLQSTDKPAASKDEMQRKLAECLRHSPALFITHHPPRSHGVHGGYYTWQDHLFPLTRLKSWAYLPLPAIGSLYPLVRSFGVSPQDLADATNQRMVGDLGAVLEQAPPLAWVAGHEHNLQVLDGAPYANFALVSGSGSKAAPVTDGDDTLYAQQALGFMEIDFFADRAPLLIVHAQTAEGLHPTFRQVLTGG